MTRKYSVYEAKARFSEVLRKVRGGESVLITYRGEEVARVEPIESKEPTVEEKLEELRRTGVISGLGRIGDELKPIARRPGGLKRFLESRD